MPPLYWLILIVLAIAAIGYVMGRARALASAGGSLRGLHSLPSYYGYNVALTVMTPAFGLMILWLIAQPLLIDNRVSASIPESSIAEGTNRSLVMSDVRRVADGLDTLVTESDLTREEVSDMRTDFEGVRERLADAGVALGSNVQSFVLEAAQDYRAMAHRGTQLMWGAVLLLAMAGFAVSYTKTHKDLRARNTVELGITVLLIGAACLAILTTIGILFSLVFNTARTSRSGLTMERTRADAYSAR